jgi:molecular chaperone GrpE
MVLAAELKSVSNEQEVAAENPETKEEEEEAVEEDLKSLKSRVEDLLNQLKYLRADYDNLMKRSSREADETRKIANIRILKKVIELKEAMDPALELVSERGDPSVVKGFQLIATKTQEILQSEGVSEIDALGKTFDPYYHEVAQTLESPEPDGKILQVFRKGYILNGVVLRPCMVCVSKHVEKVIQ